MAYRLKLTNTVTSAVYYIQVAAYDSESTVRALLQNLNDTMQNNFVLGTYNYDGAIYDGILANLPNGINGCIAVRANNHVKPPLYLKGVNNSWHNLEAGSYFVNDTANTILISRSNTRLMGTSQYDDYINVLNDLAQDTQSGINAYTNINIQYHKAAAGSYYLNGFNAAFTAIYYNTSTQYLRCLQGYTSIGTNYIKDKWELYIGAVAQQTPTLTPDTSDNETNTETGEGEADSEDNIGGDGIFNLNDINITVNTDEYESNDTGLLGSGLATLKNIDSTNLANLGSFLYSDGMVEALQKFFAGDAEKAIIDLYQLPIELPHETNETEIKFGAVGSGVYGRNVTRPIFDYDCGSVEVTNINTNSFLDFAPYMKYYVFLPFIGVRELETNLIRSVEDNGVTLSLKYKIDALSGDCVAKLSISSRKNYALNDNNGTLTVKNTKSNFIIKEFTGNCKKSLPRGSSNKLADMISGVTSVFGGIVAASNGTPDGIINGLSSSAQGITNILGNHVSASSMGSNLGYLSLRTPYLMCFSPVIYSRGNKFGQKNGYASEKYCKLNSTRGYVKVKNVIMSNFAGTANEQARIEELLKKGVWCK